MANHLAYTLLYMFIVAEDIMTQIILTEENAKWIEEVKKANPDIKLDIDEIANQLIEATRTKDTLPHILRAGTISNFVAIRSSIVRELKEYLDKIERNNNADEPEKELVIAKKLGKDLYARKLIHDLEVLNNVIDVLETSYRISKEDKE